MAYEQRAERDHGGIGAAGGAGGAFEGGLGRGRGKRPVTDYGSTMFHWMRNRQPHFKGSYTGEMERPSPSYIVDMLPPLARRTNPADTIPVKHLHSSLNKAKHPINVVCWTPEGRRLLTASSSGEFTLWNGMGFNFETIQQAHDVAIRALKYSHNDDWLISADHDGIIKYWQPNFNNVKVIQGHNDPIRDLAFSPNDSKFVTASDDSTLKVFDFAGGAEELSITGHSWDAKSVDWHPTKGLLVSGSKDHLVKLWDPRSGRCLTTLHGHKNTITKTLFEKIKGNCLATSARDQTARIFDLRKMRDCLMLKGHEKDISTMTWHPIHANLLSTGGSDGALFHYILDEQHAPLGVAPSLPPWDCPDPETAPPQSIWPAHKVSYAHDFAIWSLSWHPLGHILASGSNDRITRFWTRARPGEVECFKDRYHIGEAAAEAQGTWDRRSWRQKRQEEEEQELEDEQEGLVDQKMPPKIPGFPGIPGLPLPQFGKDGSGTAATQSLIPGMGALPPPPPPPSALNLPGLNGVQMSLLPMDPSNPPDFAILTQMMKKAGLPPPPPLGTNGQFPPPPPGILPPGLLPPNFQLPPGFPPPPPGLPGLSSAAQLAVPPPNQTQSANVDGDATTGGVRRRGPLPSQAESLQAEQRRGNFTRAK